MLLVQKMDITRLVKFNYRNPPTSNIPRTLAVISAYDSFIKTDGPDNFKLFLQTKLSKSKFYFCKNNFPYNIEEPIKHSCLWYKGTTDEQDIIVFLNENNITYVTFFENPKHLKSVKDISHLHVFHY
jgi:hypothetical protein